MYYLQNVTSTLAATGSLWKGTGLPWNLSATAYSTGYDVLPSGVTQPMEQIVEIVVGAAGKLAFNPDSVSAMKGTLLRFNFLGLNHTLTQSSFAHPCLNSSMFDTGFQQFNPTNTSGKYLVEFKVESDEPRWFYCGQSAPKPHCYSGMVFSLNPDRNHEEFVKNAMDATPPSQVTSTPSRKICSGLAYTTPSSTTNLTSYRPSGGTLSWNSMRPNATSIVPEISNWGNKLRYDALYIFIAAVVMAFEL